MTLYEILAALDAAKRTAKRNVSDLYNDPRGYAEKMVGHMKNQNASVTPVASGGELTNRPMTREERAAQAFGSVDFGGGLAGTFIGKSSPMFRREAAAAALNDFRKGATPAEVWQKHPHNWILPDGQVAQELDDSTAKIVAPWLPDKQKLIAERDRATQAFMEAQQKYKAGEIDYPAYEPFVRARLKAENDVVTPPRTEVGNMPLRDFYQHPTLYQAHPELGALDVRFNPHTKTSYHDPAAGLVEIGTKNAENQQALLGVVAHEGQHPIQDIEGWATGGSPDLFAGVQDAKRRLTNFIASTQNPADKAVAIAEREKLKQYAGYDKLNEMDAYRSLFGEQMAYATQRRANMSMDERAANFPGAGFEYPVEETIWRMNRNMSAPPFSRPNAGGYGSRPDTAPGQTITHTGVPGPETALSLEELERRRLAALGM